MRFVLSKVALGQVYLRILSCIFIIISTMPHTHTHLRGSCQENERAGSFKTINKSINKSNASPEAGSIGSNSASFSASWTDTTRSPKIVNVLFHFKKSPICETALIFSVSRFFRFSFWYEQLKVQKRTEHRRNDTERTTVKCSTRKLSDRH